MLRRATGRWLLHGIGSAAVTPLLLLGLVALAQWSLGARLAAPSSPTPAALTALLATTLALVAAGCAALAWVRPQRAGLSPPHVMLSLGFGGMLAGLGIDVAQAGPQRLDALCAAGAALPFLDAVRLHAEFLPAMHAGMLAGGLLAIPSLRLLRPGCARALCSLVGQNALCSMWMLLGMTGGALAMQRWLPPDDTTSALPSMLGGMFVGMTWGMVASVALVRAAYALRAVR